jgi:hypothetical protein
MFINLDSKNCPVTSCALMQKGCASAYTQGAVSVSASPAFELRAIKNKVSGYDQTICLKCSNGVKSVQQDNINIK